MLIGKEGCCGCSACQEICPHAAIVMQEDVKGFRYPVILEDKCVKCGLCQIVCNAGNYYLKNQCTVIARLKDEEQLVRSQSGGAFVALSDIILNAGGVCYGVGMDEKFEAVHRRAGNEKERDEMRGSKYVQSRMENTYRLVEEDLKDKKVLFSGTPCQVGGLLKYLATKKADMQNLYTVDLICHGVSSVKIWRDLINYNQKNMGRWNKWYSVARISWELLEDQITTFCAKTN